MNKFYLFLSLTILTNAIVAQVDWLPIGSVRTYFVSTGFDIENYGLHTYTVIKDTVVNNKAVKLVHYKDKKGYTVTHYFFQQDQKLYELEYHYQTNTYTPRLTYDLSLNVGDIFEEQYVIEEVKQMQIGSKILRAQILQHKEQVNLPKVMIIEGIGAVGDVGSINKEVCSPFIFHYGCTGFVDGPDYYFVCYQGPDFFYDPFGNCINNIEEAKEISIVMHPNPIKQGQTIHFDCDEPISHVELSSMDGKSLINLPILNNSIELPPTLSVGIYAVKVTTERSGISFHKLIVSH